MWRISIQGLRSADLTIHEILGGYHARYRGPIFIAEIEQTNVHVMLQLRALPPAIRTKISARSFRATGIATCLQNGGNLEPEVPSRSSFRWCIVVP